MGTKEDSKIRHARKQHRCVRCGVTVEKSEPYYDHKVGLRRSDRYCVSCAHTLKLPNAVPFSLTCTECDAGENVDTFQQAKLEGWLELMHTGDLGNAWFMGLCPQCVPLLDFEKVT